MRGNDGFERGRIANRCHDRLHAKGGGGGFEGIQIKLGIGCRGRVEQDGDPGEFFGRALTHEENDRPAPTSAKSQPGGPPVETSAELCKPGKAIMGHRQSSAVPRATSITTPRLLCSATK